MCVRLWLLSPQTLRGADASADSSNGGGSPGGSPGGSADADGAPDGPTAAFFSALLAAFRQSVLPTYKCRCIQFVLFYAASFSPSFLSAAVSVTATTSPVGNVLPNSSTT